MKKLAILSIVFFIFSCNQVQKSKSEINGLWLVKKVKIGENEMTAGELKSRGYYQGSNVSYNVKKMVENGYLEQERSIHDKRSIRVKLSEKGLELKNDISAMFSRHEEQIQGSEITDEALSQLNGMLKMLERFWAQQTNFSTGGF